MKIVDLLEGVSNKLFHYTDPKSALGILESDAFKLTTAFGTDADRAAQSKGKLYYLSTTRTVTGRYHDMVGDSAVMINLDGRKLSQNYSGSPVDYWGREFRLVDPRSESEDRIYSEKPVIENASKYITAIHVYSNPDRVNDAQHKMIRQLLISAKKNSIPVYYYDDSKAWKFQTISKAVRFEDKQVDKKDRYPDVPSRNYLAPYIELLKKENKKDLSKKAKSLLDAVRWHEHEFVTAFKNDIHNVRTRQRNRVANLISALKEKGISDAQQFKDFIIKKWELD